MPLTALDRLSFIDSVFYSNQAVRNMSEALEKIDVTGLENDNEKLKEKFKEAVGPTRS